MSGDVIIGNMIFQDNLLICSEIIFDYAIEFTKDLSLSEADIDSKTAKILDNKLGWVQEKEFRQGKSNISEIDDYIKSKQNSTKKGKVDFYILIEDKLKILIDNKKPKESIEQGIKDAQYYADGLIEKEYDIRIIMAYNGIDCLLRVYNSKEKKWKSFLIDGKELKAFPSRDLVNLIYRYKDLEGIKITEDSSGINISIIIKSLKEIYRKITFIQNDNQKTIDFTIAFIALKLILEKHGSELGRNWKDFDINEQKKLKEKIKNSVEDIVDNLKNGYGEIFKFEEDKTGKVKAFDFLDVINQFSNKKDETHLIKIFKTLDKLPHLHSSKFDIFSEIYQHLMDKHTKKILGQFFTPRHLIRALVRLFYEDEIPKLVGDIDKRKAKNPKIICDVACGTGGFLTESFKYIATNVSNVDVKALAKKSIHGFDIYPANAVRSRINMYLAGDGFSQIEPLDTLKYKDKEFDYILTNPPFGAGELSVDSNIINNKKLEINFLINVIKLLKYDGKALIIVPDGILEATTLSSLREWLVKNVIIEKIISLPRHEFAPYTHEKTHVLFIKKRVTPIEDLNEIKTERIWAYITDCDGYANSDKKFRTGKTDKNGKWLHDELSIWRDNKGAFHISLLEECWKKKEQNSNEKFTNEWGEETKGKKYGYIEMKDILKDKHTSYEVAKEKDIIKLLIQTEEPPKKLIDIFEEEEDEIDSKDSKKKRFVKRQYLQILETNNIEYDEYEDKFYDKNKEKIKNVINLAPENYLRKKDIIKIDFNKFKEQNNIIIKQIEEELGNIIKEK